MRRRNNTSGVSGKLNENKANQIIEYYNNSLTVLKKFYKEGEMEKVLNYMERKGKTTTKPLVMIGIFSDSSKVVTPGTYFDKEVRTEIEQKYREFFDAGNKFFDNYEKYKSYITAEDYKDDNWEKGNAIEQENIELYSKISELRSDIYSILIPIADEAEKVTLVGNPLRDHILKAKEIFAAMKAAIDEYAEEEVNADVIDIYYSQTEILVEEARELKPVDGEENKMRGYGEFLDEVDAFLGELRKSKRDNKFDQRGFDRLMSEYDDAISIYNTFVS